MPKEKSTHQRRLFSLLRLPSPLAATTNTRAITRPNHIVITLQYLIRKYILLIYNITYIVNFPRCSNNNNNNNGKFTLKVKSNRFSI